MFSDDPWENKTLLYDAVKALPSKATMVERARLIAEFAHAHQTRFSGEPYFQHCLNVATSNPRFDDVRKATAFLHDVLQKTPVTRDDLSNLGMYDKVIIEVDTLTPKRGEPYFDSIERINPRLISRDVKIEDNLDNMDRDTMPEWRRSLKLEFNWSFQYPLAIALMRATNQGLVKPDVIITDFISSQFCPEKLRTPERLLEFGSTSHPIPSLDDF